MNAMPSEVPGHSSRSDSDPVLAVLDFEASRVALRPADIRRYVLISILIVELAVSSAFLLGGSGPKVYGVRSEIFFERRTEQPTGFLREDRNLTTQLVTLRSRAVLGPVARANRLSVEELSKKLEVSIVDSSEILRVQVNDRSVAEGTKLVAAITKEYLAGAESVAPAETKRFFAAQLAKLNSEVDQKSKRSAQLETERIGRATRANPNPPASPEQTRLDNEIQSLHDQITGVRSNLDTASLDLINQPRVSVLTSPYALDDPVSPKPLRAAIAGGLAGIMIAALTVALLVRRHGPPTHRP